MLLCSLAYRYGKRENKILKYHEDEIEVIRTGNHLSMVEGEFIKQVDEPYF